MPARQVLAATRVAATVGSEEVLHETLTDRALTVLHGFPVEDLLTIKDVLSGAFPHRQWRILDPDVTHDALAKGAQDRFKHQTFDALDLIKPVLILQPDGLTLPAAVRATASAVYTLSPVTRDIIVTFVEAGSLSHEITDITELRDSLPANEALAQLSMIEICAASRALNRPGFTGGCNARRMSP